MPRVARVGDPGSHGGAISSGSPTGTCDGRPIARVGDIYDCPIHGPNAIADGSGTTTVDGRREARLGDPTLCGAIIADGSPTHNDEGA